MGNGTKANGLTVTHEMPKLELDVSAYQVNPQETAYRTEVKETSEFTDKDWKQVIPLSASVFKPKKGLHTFVRDFYFNDDRKHILSYDGRDVKAIHSFYPFDVDGYKILNFAFAVVDKEYRNNGMCKKSIDLMLDYGRTCNCSIATLRLFSPEAAEKFSKSGFQTPIVHDVDRELIEVGKVIGDYFRETLDNNLMIDTSKSQVPTFSFKPVQIPAEDQRLNDVLLGKDNKRIRMVCRL